ncbi:hypothetical protein CsatB_003252 [Cannabis sativa]|uniref:Methyltransferase PMT26 n=1 Tax=Cannabis sativa TaxID=3483 RepID=A0A803PR68_CANSA
MAPGKYSRGEGKKSSGYCSTVSIVVFVAFCLVGIWMFMSSAVPVQDRQLQSESDETRNEVKRQVVNDGNSKQFEDSSGDLQEDATDNSGVDSQTVVETQEETSSKEEAEAKNESQNGFDEKKTVSEDDNANSVNGDSNSETGEKEEEVSRETNEGGQAESDGRVENESNDDQTKQKDEMVSSTEEKDEKNQETDSQQSDAAELLKERNVENGAWSTQVVESEQEKSQQDSTSQNQNDYDWKLCKVTAGPDYIPCLDNWRVIRKLPSTKHYEHRERHCPDESPTCLVALPEGYKRPVKWPASRDKIWYHNVPHTKLAEVKGHQNWVKVTGEYLTFPGGGTQFKNGALHYIDFIQKSLPKIAWGKRSRVVLDVGCGVASFGGYLFERDVLAMSFAPKDEHEAQVQFALERGIPAISAVMGTKRLPFPGAVFDLIHCARCRVPWHVEGGKLLLELNRVLRPGGYFVWSATPVYQKLPEDVGIWKAMSRLTKAMCWDLIVVNKDRLNGVGAAIYRKPISNECYSNRSRNEPPLCSESDDPNAAWNVPLEACMHEVPEEESKRGSRWPAQWPSRLEKAPYWLNSQVGVYGKAAPEDFAADYKHWKNVVSQTYLEGMGISWSSVRNVMDMKAVYGGFAAALKDLKIWVMNVVPIDSPDTLPIIYERGLIGIYHDWCESFSTYPRSYDILHADHLFSVLKDRCNLRQVMAEADRMLRPEGKLIVRDNVETINEVESMAKSLKWDVRFIFSNDKEGLLCVQKSFWRPTQTKAISSAIV